ncbi:MAG: ISAs1 family transposase, partial [Caldilineaceae bacterium]|nr:ISAs1 family transposase [Caldilineaceae bacterium]
RCGDRVTTDVRIFIASLPPKAEPRLQAVRQHWTIENAHHWVMDVAFGEDDSRIRTGHAAHNMAILKRMAHNLLRQDRSPGWASPTSGWRPPGTRTTCAN